MNNDDHNQNISEVLQARISGTVFFFLTLSPAIAFAQQPPQAHTSARSGQQVVAAICSKCHITGVDGAPIIGNSKAWSKRVSQGLSRLTRHAVQGIRRMPAHGGQPDISDLEIARAVTDMVNRSGGRWIEPASKRELATERSGKQVVEERCANCHKQGLNGAPGIGDQSAWAQRLNQGLAYAVHSAIHGHGGMPPRGGQANLTDTEIQTAILYMYNPASADASPAADTACQGYCGHNDPNFKTAGGLGIYLGTTPVQRLYAFPKGSPERSMHGGIPTDSGYYHVNVSLFDAGTGAPVKGAHVQMQYERLGLSRDVIELEPMAVGIGSYGNYLKPQPETPYRITLQILRPGALRTVELRLEDSYFQ